MSSPASVLSACAACGASSPLVCASCLKTVFCSPACAAAAWAGHRAACADFTVLSALPDEAPAPVPPAAQLASMDPAAVSSAGAPAFAGSGFSCAVCGSCNAAVCARCRLVGYCGAEHQRKDWPVHKLVCRKGEFGVVPVLTWEQRVLAEAAAAAPASLAAAAAQPLIPGWDLGSDGAPPAKIMRAWRHAAEGGHPFAQHLLGICYENGCSFVRDIEAAVARYAKSAAQGFAMSQRCLGVCYVNGSGVAKDHKIAFLWFAKAAAQGDAMAQFSLGFRYQHGLGVAQDSKAAAAWYTRASEQGNVRAQFNLALAYEFGFGVARDIEAAAALFAKAAEQGVAEAAVHLDACLQHIAAETLRR
jgi:hypothetical protein